MKTATLVVQQGGYHCPECLRVIEFETAEQSDYGCGDQLDKRGFAIGKCVTWRCDRYGVRIKVRLQTIEVEELPTTEENPHGATTTEDRPAPSAD